jgi:hypothetical protein
MTTPSLEILSIPKIVRKIQIWVYSNESGSILVNWGGQDQIFLINSQEHRPIVVTHGNESANDLIIECLTGQVCIGSIDINYSWAINPYFTSKYPDQVALLLESDCNLNVVDSDFRNDLVDENLFLSTEENNFSSVSNLVSNVHINNQSQNFEHWYYLTHNDIYSSSIHATTPAIDSQPQTLLPEQKIIESSWKYHYDKDFISNLDTRFYEFVNKKLSNESIQWNNQMFTGYRIPYGYAVRIQTQLVDNIELIRNKRIVDLGTDRGQFLYPCLELGCASIIGVQPLDGYNNAINQALTGLNYNDRASAVWGDAYDLAGLIEILKDKDTLLMLGLLYHLNNHYQLLETVTKTDLTGLVIDIAINAGLDHHTDSEPKIKWMFEQQNVDVKGWELAGINKDWTWVGLPNASWLIQTLQFLGWKIKSNVMHSNLRTSTPQLKHRGIITAYR